MKLRIRRLGVRLPPSALKKVQVRGGVLVLRVILKGLGGATGGATGPPPVLRAHFMALHVVTSPNFPTPKAVPPVRYPPPCVPLGAARWSHRWSHGGTVPGLGSPELLVIGTRLINMKHPPGSSCSVPSRVTEDGRCRRGSVSERCSALSRTATANFTRAMLFISRRAAKLR